MVQIEVLPVLTPLKSLEGFAAKLRALYAKVLIASIDINK